jgi:hypothetical protein
MGKRRRSKSEIREWLKTEEGSVWLEGKISEKNRAKMRRHKRVAISVMRKIGIHVDCAQCLHGIGGHCSWNLAGGCPDYLEVHTGYGVEELRSIRLESLP